MKRYRVVFDFESEAEWNQEESRAMIRRMVEALGGGPFRELITADIPTCTLLAAHVEEDAPRTDSAMNGEEDG